MAPTVTPYLLYEDAGAALEWLSTAFGFRETMRMDSPGYVNHAEMAVGEDGVIYLGYPGESYKNPERAGGQTVLICVYVDDVDAHYEHAKTAGAKIIEEPADQEYGERRYAAEDPEGHQWFFATPIAGS
jgi:PhnB protein